MLCARFRPPILLCVLAAPVSAQVPVPTVEGPISGGTGAPFIAATTFDLAQVGYTQSEYFVSGTASAYTNVGALDTDGVWTVAAGETAPYKTRILVYRPAKRHQFNRTVIVEWLNVSGGLDAAPDWIMAHTELIRHGYAWVGVSAQFVGVEGGPGIGGLPSMGLKPTDPNRYGSLSHPGDSFSYDILSQVGAAIREPGTIPALQDLTIRRLIAVGESQSAFRLVTYINALEPIHGMFDGYLVHSRGESPAALSQSPQVSIPVPGQVLIRTDLQVPVLTFQTETDLTLLGSFRIRQPDTDLIRLWEVAGTAHADSYTTVAGPTDQGDDPSVANVIFTTEPVPGLITCDVPINSGPQHVVLKAAIHALERWVRRGKPPAPAPLLDVVTDPAITIQRDPLGNALGGIRTPWVDVPVATHSGGGQVGSILCLLFGSSVPLDPTTLDQLYPTHRSYMQAFRKSTREAVRQRHIRGRDARLMRKAAKDSNIGD